MTEGEAAGQTALMDAARCGRAADVVALLTDGADVNELATDGSGWTALLVACGNGHPARGAIRPVSRRGSPLATTRWMTRASAPSERPRAR